MNGLTALEHKILNELYVIIRMKKETDRWQALNTVASSWEACKINNEKYGVEEE